MNYYNNPFMNLYPYSSMSGVKTGLFRGLFRNGINWGSLLSNTQRTLGIINQTIPVVKQISPVMKNAKTMFRVMNEFKKFDTPVSKTPQKDNQKADKNTSAENNLEKNYETNNNNGPVFFI